MQFSNIKRAVVALLLAASLLGTSAAALAAGQGRTAQATASFTFTPVADAYVIKSQPSSNFGKLSSLRADASPVTRSYLRFTVSGLNGASVQSAKLRVYANNANGTGISVLRLSNTSWGETAITFKNAPAPGTVISRSKGFSADA
jgi:acid phosphatase type 7